MSFSSAVITHSFLNADGTPASGSVTFSLSKAMTNGSTTIVPATITANLSSGGVLSQALTSNADALTQPTDASWRVDIRILGAEIATYFISIPSGGGTIDLGTLLPGAQQVG